MQGRRCHKGMLAQAALEEGAGVDAGPGMSLDVHEVAAVIVRRGSPEMAKPDVVKRSGRLEAGDMAAELGRFLVGTQNNRNRVPANDGADAVLDGAIPARALRAGNGASIFFRGLATMNLIEKNAIITGV